MGMSLIVQIVCILLAMVSMGQSIRTGAATYEKVLYAVFSLIYLVLCIVLQGVR